MADGIIKSFSTSSLYELRAKAIAALIIKSLHGDEHSKPKGKHEDRTNRAVAIWELRGRMRKGE